MVGPSAAVIVGSEGNGLSVDIQQALARRKNIKAVHVPKMHDIKSLNAAV
jgi:tRNA G18 (ribose-2'-O)-methylase SpoU